LNSINREILGESGKSLKDQWGAFEGGDYGETSVMAVVVSILSNGGNVDHLRGELPDKLIDFFAECLKDTMEGHKESVEDKLRGPGIFN